jgi:hypothetical protein
MSIDFTKPVQTRDGRKARILCTDRTGGLYPVVGLVSDGRIETTTCWMRDGTHVAGEHGLPMDLINVPPPKKKVKVMVEIRRDIADGEVFAVATIDRRPHNTPNKVLASAIVEMEYEDQP